MLHRKNLTVEQNAAIDRLFDTDETLLIAGLGFGKAIVGLTAMVDLISDRVLTRVLVIAPMRTATLTWGSEPQKWSHIPDSLVAVACGSVKERTAVCDSTARVVVTNFENLEWILDYCGRSFDGLLIDECSKLSTVGGGAVRKLRHFAKKVKWRVGMSATPVAESGEGIYGQALCLDLGKALGTRYETFQRKYFFPTDYQNRNWQAFVGAYQQMADALSDLVFVADDGAYRRALPAVEEILVPVKMAAHTRDLDEVLAQTGMIKDLALPVRAETAAQVTNKRHQLAAGGLYTYNKKREQVLVYGDTAKQLMLEILLAGLDRSPKIIFYQYQFELDQLLGRWPGTPVLGQGTKFTTHMLAEWDAGYYPLLFAHHASASHGLNLQQVCDTIIHLSPIWGRDPWQQTLGRIRRRGQRAATVRRYVLVATGMIDEAVLEKQDMKEAREGEFMDALEAVG